MNGFCFLTNLKPDRISCQTLFYSQRLSHKNHYTPALRSLILFLAGKMNLKTKNKMYMRIIEEMCNKCDGAKEFVDNRIKELSVQDR